MQKLLEALLTGEGGGTSSTPLATPTPSSVGPSLSAAFPENPGAGREPRTETEKEIAGSSSSDSAAVVAASPVVEPRVPRPPFSGLALESTQEAQTSSSSSSTKVQRLPQAAEAEAPAAKEERAGRLTSIEARLEKMEADLRRGLERARRRLAEKKRAPDKDGPTAGSPTLPSESLAETTAQTAQELD